MENDKLTTRERKLYKVIHGTSLLWGITGFYLFFIGKHVELGYFVSTVYVLGCTPTLVFGLALKNDTRIIYGVRWLRETESEKIKT